MKSWERDAMIREEGREEGREEERVNTERERRRADEAEIRADAVMSENLRLKQEIERLQRENME